MALQPVNRRSVPEDVFEQIVTEVLSGEMRPGESLPSERRLAEVLGVSRPAIREALKRLTAAGQLDFSVAHSILEPRLHKGPKVSSWPRRVGPRNSPDHSTMPSTTRRRGPPGRTAAPC